MGEVKLGPLSDLQHTAAIVSDTARWVHDASNPYWDWLWGSSAEAPLQVVKWIERSTSEIAAERIVVVRDESSILGGYIAMAGADLQRCRRADFLTLANYARSSKDADILSRIRQAGLVFGPVSDDSYYLSRIGVQNSARGKGLGRMLMESYLETGRASGFINFILDVSSDNRQAIELYRRMGFVITGTAEPTDCCLRYSTMELTTRGELGR